MLLMLGGAGGRKSMSAMDQAWSVRNGFFDGLGTDVTGKTIGIVGMGRIGRGVAERARGFRMPIIYHNRNRLPSDQEAGANYYASMEEMLPHCQVLSSTCRAGRVC